MAAAAPPPWVILRRILSRKDEAEAEHSPAAVSTTLKDPLQVTILAVAVAQHNRPGRRIRSDDLPYLVATGTTALLLCFCASPVPIVTNGLIVARRFVAPRAGADPSQEPTTGITDLVPPRTGPSMPATYKIRSVGFIPALFGGYVIAELQVTRRSNRAKLFRVVSGHEHLSEPGRLFVGHDRKWLVEELDYPLSAVERDWHSNGVVAHANKLWWFDLSWGLLSCNPLFPTDDLLHPALRFHDLPPGCYLPEARPFLHASRCICVSENMLRYVDIHPDGGPREWKVVMWTYCCISDPGDEWKWDRSYETDLQAIWNDGNYQRTGLSTRVVPQIVLVNPRNHNVVYFFRNEIFFAVDVPSHRVLHFVKNCSDLDKLICRHCVFPWDLPPSIASGIVPFPEQGGSPSTSQGSRG